MSLIFDASTEDEVVAFWQIPMHLSEQKYFCTKGLTNGERKRFAFQRAVQGSSQLWGRLAALLMRLTQSLFLPDVVRLMCYVNDLSLRLEVHQNIAGSWQPL